MTLDILGDHEYQNYFDTLECHPTFQPTLMAALLQKRGKEPTNLGLRVKGVPTVAGLVFTQPRTGGQYREQYFGPNVKDYAYRQDTYLHPSDYAKANGVLELVGDPYESYHEFATNGNPLGESDEKLINTRTNLGFEYEGCNPG